MEKQYQKKKKKKPFISEHASCYLYAILQLPSKKEMRPCSRFIENKSRCGMNINREVRNVAILELKNIYIQIIFRNHR